MYNWEKCALDVWFPVSLCVADVLLNPGHAGQGLLHCTTALQDAVWRVSVHFIDVSSGGVSATSTNPAPSSTPVKQSSECKSQSTSLVQSYAGGNSCQSSDSFSALGTLLPDNRVANAHTQWNFLFRPEGKKSWGSCVVMPYQPSTAVWCCDPLLALEASLGK